ncbi:MAG: 2-oxoacid:ferredoxin oxidoreductase subunit gamma [Firmicutes bacterium]|nr:2-oxoacid:ferredoxin oxidoreductase subunit gamma [Bacillota bacterium]
MSYNKEIRLTGSGGQGLILGGIILAEAALLDDLNAVQTQSYGPEARGGASKAEVIISNDDINYPKVRQCDLLLTLTNVACDKYISTLKEGGTLIIDSNVDLPDRKDIDIVQLPIMDTATKDIGTSLVANIVALGALNAKAKVVSKESLKEAILSRVPRGTEEVNSKAYEKGIFLTEKEMAN